MQRNITQSKEALLKSYNTRLKEDVRSMLENFEGEKFGLYTVQIRFLGRIDLKKSRSTAFTCFRTKSSYLIKF